MGRHMKLIHVISSYANSCVSCTAFAILCFMLTAYYSSELMAFETLALNSGTMNSNTPATNSPPVVNSLAGKTIEYSVASDITEARVPLPAGAPSPPWNVLQEKLEQEPDLACRISYKQTAAALKSRPPPVVTGGFPPIALAPYGVFMSDCKKMPPMVQKCQMFQFIIHNRFDCIQARRKYDEQVQDAAIKRRVASP